MQPGLGQPEITKDKRQEKEEEKQNLRQVKKEKQIRTKTKQKNEWKELRKCWSHEA